MRNATMKTSAVTARKRHSKGFTLIELMIGIAIIGILSAIAIPAFQDYLNRSKVTELVNIAQSCKVGVIEFAATNNAWPANASQAGCQTALQGAGTQYARELLVLANGRIQVSFQNRSVAVDINDGNYIALIPWTGNARHEDAVRPIGEWRCVTNVVGDPLRYIPAACRNNDVP
jgi:type IV pilus assembly protein PilA